MRCSTRRSGSGRPPVVDDPSIPRDSAERSGSSASTAPRSSGKAPTSGDSSAPPEPASEPLRSLNLDICWLLLQHAERCLLDGEAILTVSSRQIRAELLGMGYGERELTERDVRLALRSLIRRSQAATHPAPG